MNIEFINDAYTSDGLRLPMIHFESDSKEICVVFIHGMCQTILDNEFAIVTGKKLMNHKIGFLYAHNRGYSIENDLLKKDGTYQRCGCMYEIFEDCIKDIDLAIKEAKNLGYQKIILMGHSYGCNKVIYYYHQKKPDILGIILASAPDMVGSHVRVQMDYKELLNEAKENMKKGKPMKLLHKMIEDYMYMSSGTYYNWYQEDSNVDNLPILRNPVKWEQLECVDVPILTFSGSLEEDYYLHLDLLKTKASNCSNFKYQYIEGANHFYRGKENDMSELVLKWIQNL